MGAVGQRNTNDARYSYRSVRRAGSRIGHRGGAGRHPGDRLGRRYPDLVRRHGFVPNVSGSTPGAGGVPTGIGAVLTDANPPVVKSVALGNVNGVSLGVGGTTGSAKATKDGNSYKITADRRYRRAASAPDATRSAQLRRKVKCHGSALAAQHCCAGACAGVSAVGCSAVAAPAGTRGPAHQRCHFGHRIRRKAGGDHLRHLIHTPLPLNRSQLPSASARRRSVARSRRDPECLAPDRC
jgi:Mycobacterium 19 kDa lipoprotein antigen